MKRKREAASVWNSTAVGPAGPAVGPYGGYPMVMPGHNMYGYMGMQPNMQARMGMVPHARAPRGPNSGKVCSFFQTVRGCSKGASCDFLHQPVEKKMKVCTFFNTPEGCKKGEGCDFVHGDPSEAPVSAPEDQLASDTQETTDPSGEEKTVPSTVPATSTGTDRRSICLYFNTPNGCKKGEICDFAHVKGERTRPPAPAPVAKICEFWQTANGCRKGSLCNFQHPGFQGQQNPPRGTTGTRVCSFFSSPRGCIKGDVCDFQHVQPTSIYSAAAQTGVVAAESQPGWNTAYAAQGYYGEGQVDISAYSQQYAAYYGQQQQAEAYGDASQYYGYPAQAQMQQGQVMQQQQTPQQQIPQTPLQQQQQYPQQQYQQYP